MKGAVAKAEEIVAERRAPSWPASSPTRPTRRSTAGPPPRRSGRTPTARSTSSSPASAPAAPSPASARCSRRASPACRSSPSSRRSPPILNGGAPGPHKIQGIGANFVPEILDTDVYDEVIDVNAETSVDVGPPRRQARRACSSASPPAPRSPPPSRSPSARRTPARLIVVDHPVVRRALPVHHPLRRPARLTLPACDPSVDPPWRARSLREDLDAAIARDPAADVPARDRPGLAGPARRSGSTAWPHRLWQRPGHAAAWPGCSRQVAAVGHRGRDPPRRADRPPASSSTTAWASSSARPPRSATTSCSTTASPSAAARCQRVKRHPTVGNRVTIGAGARVLGPVVHRRRRADRRELRRRQGRPGGRGRHRHPRRHPLPAGPGGPLRGDVQGPGALDLSPHGEMSRFVGGTGRVVRRMPE